ncbi:MAG TPA: 6-phosphogluconolactonase [Thermoanaerobaculia bacterium]|nr:6-phosphogluconolactonase [Thermoanaerobaculia bacterium]
MNLRILDDAESLAHAAARTILQSGAKTIVVTGGSTPKRLYEILGESLPENVTWILLDERYVPLSDPQSNAAMIERTLFARGVPERWLRFRTELEDPAETARVFEDDWCRLGIGDVDLVLLGCGDDGHTASLFPGTPVLEVEDRIASEVFVPRLDQWRETLTMPVIRAAKTRMVLATGASKANIIREVREGADYPIARATNGVETWWFVDREAAG